MFEPLTFAARLGRAKDLSQIQMTDIVEEELVLKAIKSAHEKTVRAVLKHRPKMHDFDEQGQTPLHLSCASMSGRIVRLLLEYGSDFNIRSKWSGGSMGGRAKHFGPGLTALHFCAAWGNIGGVTALLEARADVNAG